MAIDLSKVVFKRLEDGAYTIIPKRWELKTTANSEDYVQVTAQLKGTDRMLTINLFEKGLTITLANVMDHLLLGEMPAVDVLQNIIDKELPAYHQTVTLAGKTYYNWYICSAPQQQATTNDDSDDGPGF